MLQIILEGMPKTMATIMPNKNICHGFGPRAKGCAKQKIFARYLARFWTRHTKFRAKYKKFLMIFLILNIQF